MTDVDLGLLIELIASHPHLYDLKSKNYKDSEMKENTWTEIGIVMHIPIDECKRLWKNLRDRFSKEKRLKSGDSQKESEWIYYNKMLFYDNHCIRRKTVSATLRGVVNKKDGDSRSTSSCSNSSLILPFSPESPAQELMDLQEDEHSQAQPNTSHALSRSPSPPPPPPPLESTPENYTVQKSRKTVVGEPLPNETPKTKKKKNDDVREIMEVVRKISSQVTTTNVNEAFGTYIANKLNELPENEAKEMRRKLFIVAESINDL